MKQGTFLLLKLLITFLNELVMGQLSFSAKCTGLLLHIYFKSMALQQCDKTLSHDKFNTQSSELAALL